MDIGFEMIGQPILDLLLPFILFVGIVTFLAMVLTRILPLPRIIKNEVSNFVVGIAALGSTYYYFTKFI